MLELPSTTTVANAHNARRRQRRQLPGGAQR